MIRICYEDFSAGTHDGNGLHGRSERGARGATIHLLPGLTAGERRAVLRRLRQEASRGLGPPLPRPQLAVALGFDRVRMAARMAKAVVRLHPAVTLLPGVFVVALLALFVAASAEGARVGLAKERVGLADAVAARSGQDPQTGTGQLQSAQISGVTVVFGVHAKQAPVQHHHGKELARVALQSDASYIYPQAVAALIPQQRVGQPTLRPAPLSAAPPYITIPPGPRDLAR